MAKKKGTKNIRLKALVDNESNKVIFVESERDFIDVVFSFLTIPMGSIVKLACNHSVPVEIGCIKNLYHGIEKSDVYDFRSNACRDMLLLPRNAAHSHCKNLKLKIETGEPTRYYMCHYCSIWCSKNFSSYHRDTVCPTCPRSMDLEVNHFVDDSQVGGVFVKGRPRLMFTDDLQVIPPLRLPSISFFAELGVTDIKTTHEELTFNIGVEEVLNLLMNALLSKAPMTETLLKHKPLFNSGDANSNQGLSIDSQGFGDAIDEEEKSISIKLTVSKSTKMVCYAETRDDFVNLLYSFLTLPLGFILEKIQNASWKGCVDQLYKSVQDLDEQYFKSDYHKELLVNPKLVPGFCYENSLLGIEEASLYFRDNKVSTDKSQIKAGWVKLEVMDPKSHDDKDKSAHGFLEEPAMFTVTDNLVVRPVSPIFEMSVLQELEIPFTDIEDQTVYVGKKEALRLLVASFVGDSALTNAFLRDHMVPKQEQ